MMCGVISSVGAGAGAVTDGSYVEKKHPEYNSKSVMCHMFMSINKNITHLKRKTVDTGIKTNTGGAKQTITSN